MFKVPEHQVAGHQALKGRLGPVVDDSGRFYKPLQSDERGKNEVAFYKSLSSKTESLIPDNIRRFFPVFYGTELVEATDGSGPKPHLVLQNLNVGLKFPSIMDIKIGTRTWYPQASEMYITKCLKKDRESSTVKLGFRLCGLQVYNSKESGYWKPDRKAVAKLSAEDVKMVLRKFVSDEGFDSDHPDCSVASIVLGGPNGILSQLRELKAWFEDQTMYHFYSCSVLMMYDKEKALSGGDPVAEVKMIDFAHVGKGNGVIDHNFLGGLCSLIKFVSDIHEYSLKDSQEKQISYGNGDI
ncbi:hypothetical protein Leryth_015831 [Lithospermum erythrorhizon]|nr:hypothetical protein Leryth_015831 [Lithospermum erythrorhizon]